MSSNTTTETNNMKQEVEVEEGKKEKSVKPKATMNKKQQQQQQQQQPKRQRSNGSISTGTTASNTHNNNNNNNNNHYAGRRNSNRSNRSTNSLIKNPLHYLRDRMVKKAAFVVEQYVHDMIYNNKTSFLYTNLIQQQGEGGRKGDITTPSPVPTIPLLERKELQIGKLRGEGSFCQIWQVTGIHLQQPQQQPLQQQARQELVNSLSSSSRNSNNDNDNNNNNNYVIKIIRKKITKYPSQFTLAVADLCMEAYYLQCLSHLHQHPNIITLRGMTYGGISSSMKMSGKYDSYFLLLDELDTIGRDYRTGNPIKTLEECIHLKWKYDIHQDDNNYGNYGSNSLLDTKLQYAYEIALAIQYLHQHRIIYRDLKPHNIGFKKKAKNQKQNQNQQEGENDQEYLIQLFDFGLCRELPPPKPKTVKRRQREEEEVEEEEETKKEIDHDNDNSVNSDKYDNADDNDNDNEEEDDDEDNIDEDYYHMTRVGTRRYSAVEINISGIYNEKCDVYSWAMTIYEMISLTKPFYNLSDMEHQQYVCAQGRRPNLKPFLQQCSCDDHQQQQQQQSSSSSARATSIVTLMKEAWEHYVRHRIDIHTVVERMKIIIEDRQQLQQQQQQQQQQRKAAVSDKEKGKDNITTTAAESENDGDSNNNNDNTPRNSSTQQQEHLLQINNNKNGDSYGTAVTIETKETNVTDIIHNSNKTNVIVHNETVVVVAAAAAEKSKKGGTVVLGEESEESDGTPSIQDIIVDIGGASRHSVVSGPSLGTATSGSEQTGSLRWDDSINSTSVGTLGHDASISTIQFEEYLRPRRQQRMTGGNNNNYNNSSSISAVTNNYNYNSSSNNYNSSSNNYNSSSNNYNNNSSTASPFSYSGMASVIENDDTGGAPSTPMLPPYTNNTRLRPSSNPASLLYPQQNDPPRTSLHRIVSVENYDEEDHDQESSLD